MDNKTIKKAFTPRARLLQLLGDQLIGTKILAVFELVKNAYDADSKRVSVILKNINSENPSIIVKDFGAGMSLDTITNIWLVPGHDHREKQRKNLERSKSGRLPLGEKGVGRFAVHKLGNSIELVTKAAGEKECVVKINWNDLIDKQYLSDALVEVNTREPKVFLGKRTGTKIIISDLREKQWKRGEVRSLYRQITSISSPFSKKSDNFQAKLRVPDFPEWISDIPPVSDLLKRAPWFFKFSIENGKITWSYEFRGITGIKLEPRSVQKKSDSLILPKRRNEDKEKNLKKIVADEYIQKDIGPIKGEIYVYDLDKNILKILGDYSLIQSFLDENGGVRVYRDGIRVYNYGEPGDDWLNLDVRRVNLPTKNISNNITVGMIEINLESSKNLEEKTNREGFVENDTYSRFKDLTLGALSILEIERKIDKDKIRSLTKEGTNIEDEKIIKPLEKLRQVVTKHKLNQEIDPLINKIEHDYNEMKETMLKSGLSGMGLAIIFHEVERGVRVLQSAIEESESKDSVKVQARELVRILDGFSDLLRKNEKRRNSIKQLLKRARDINRIRFRAHNIKLIAPFLEDEVEDIYENYSLSLVLNGIGNLIDNAIHWLKVRWPDENKNERKIYLNIIPNYKNSIAIVVADNGPGFVDPPELLTKPFFTRRPDGMGLGLYYTNMVMELNSGYLAFPHPDEVDLPEDFDGAVLALVFGNSKESM